MFGPVVARPLSWKTATRRVTIRELRRCIAGMRQRHRERTSVDSVLVAAIQHIPVPAFVISSSGRIVAANPAGRTWLDATPDAKSALCQRGGPDPSRFCITESRRGACAYSLAVLRGNPTPCATIRVPAEWALTPREQQVVGLVARGAPNHDIARVLCCAIRTVEHHVTNIFRKALVVSRAGLIVALMGNQSSAVPHS
jgi:DNA-binding CsgD family transcriptional regulator